MIGQASARYEMRDVDPAAAANAPNQQRREVVQGHWVPRGEAETLRTDTLLRRRIASHRSPFCPVSA